MGMDMVEMVLDVESRFGVDLPDSECSRVRTVADLAVLVAAQIRRQRGDDDVCPTARTFYSVRRALCRGAGIGRSSVRPDTEFRSLLPTAVGRRHAWRRLAADVGGVPALRLPMILDRAMLWMSGLALLVGTGVLAVTWARLGFFAALLGLGVVFGFAWLLVLFARWQSTELPSGVVTVADLVRLAAPIAVGQGGERLIGEIQILEEVRRIVADTLGMPLDRVKPDSNFARDLGAD